jgi:hypothetical protein
MERQMTRRLGIMRSSALATLAIVMFVTHARGQSSTAGPITGQTLPVSAFVLGTIVNRGNDVELLVLWRGTPMWFARSTRQAASYSGGVDGRPLTATLEYGGIQLEAMFDAGSRKAQIQGKSVPMPPGSNVILVDEIDSAGGPVISGVIALNPRREPGDNSLAKLFERSPEIVSFLRCDPGPSNAYRVVNRIVCDDLGHK